MHDSPRQALRSIAVKAIAQDDTELVPAKPRHRAVFHDLGQTPGDHPEDFVAEPMAVDVVDRLEIVEVDDEQRATSSSGNLAGPFVEVLDEPAAVGEAGKHVVAGQLIRLGFGLAPASTSRRRSMVRRTEKILAAMPRKTTRMTSQSIRSLSGWLVSSRNLSSTSYQRARQ